MRQKYKKIAAVVSLFLLTLFIFLSCYFIIVYLKWGALGCVIFLVFLFIFPAIRGSNLNGVVLRLIFWSICILKAKDDKEEDKRSKDCPSDEVLIEYMIGKLEDKNKILSQHIAGCKYCQDSLKELKLISDIQQDVHQDK